MNPQDRTEEYYAAILGAITGEGEAAAPSPVWRKEEFLAAILAAAKGEEPSIPDPVWRDEAWLALIAQAISEGGGGGGTTVEPKDVNFIDYDGTIVAAYTAEEFAALDALPANPTHEGLTAQGWNWSLSDAKTYVAECGSLCIGQMYVTDDGKTRVYINLPSTQLTLSVGLAVNGTAVVDWGDESATDTLTGASTTTVVSTQHTYAAPGDYVISIDVTGEASIVGTAYQGSNYYSQLVYDQSSYRISQYLGSRVSKIEIGDNITSLGEDALACMLFDSLTMPNTIAKTKSGAFVKCGPLKGFVFPSSVTSITTGPNAERVSIPNGITSFPSSWAKGSVKKLNVPATVSSFSSMSFSECHDLSQVTIPESVSVASISNQLFYECWSLKKIVIPATVTSINSYAFYNCYSLSEIHVKPTTPPTLNTNGFTGIPATCIIYVPSASLETYKTASNWSTYASQMVGE